MSDLKKHLKNIDDLKNHFKQIELKSLCYAEKPDNQYLCFRLDGIGMSKKFLKDHLHNYEFNKYFEASIKQTYYLMRKKSPTDGQNIFLCIFSSSDEVSFILNKFPNYYDDRIFKIGSTITSYLSSTFARKYKKEANKFIPAFDCRPILLETQTEIFNYLYYRRITYIKLMIHKVLRLNSPLKDFEIHNSEDSHNIDWLISKLIEYDLIDVVLNNINNSKLYVPNNEGKLETFTPIFQKNDLESLFQKINDFECELKIINNFA